MNEPERLQTLQGEVANKENALVLFASPEERCIGIAKKIGEYQAHKVIILRVVDEKNTQREERIRSLRRLLTRVGTINIIDTRHDDPLVGLEELRTAITTSEGNGQVTVDISTFPKNSLLLTLRAIEHAGGVRTVRIVYTEAREYKLRQPDTPVFGLRGIGIIPTFGAPFQPNEELLLVMLLGYERDRAVAMWQRVQPHRTVAAISRPSFRPQWDGIAERMNAPILAAIGDKAVYHVDPRNPLATTDFLRRVITEASPEGQENCYIAPLGTKPQTVGVYLYCRANQDAVSVIYGSPVAREHEYIADGVGPSWTLTEWDAIHD